MGAHHVIEAYTHVTVSDWWDDVPSDAEILSCKQSYRYTSDTPVANATESVRGLL